MNLKMIAGAMGLALITSAAYAVELAYTWKKGEVHRFSYVDTSHSTVNMGGMGAIEATLKVQSTFALKVQKLLPGGKADVDLTLEKLDLYQEGNKIASIAKIPPAARKIRAEIDRQGQTRFLQMVSVYLHDNQVYVGVRKAAVGPQGASASVSAGGPEGGVEVDLVAGVDPRTGKLTASASVKERPPALKRVVIKQEDPTVDALPKGLFELMVMPAGQLQVGQEQEVKLPFVTLAVSLERLEGSVATVKLSSRIKTETVPAKDEETDDAPDGADSGEAAGILGKLKVVEAPAWATPEMGKLMEEEMSGDGGPGDMNVRAEVTARFDTAAGRLLQMEGTLGIEHSVGGMGGIKNDSTFVLKRL